MNALGKLVVGLIVAAAVVLGLIAVYEGGKYEDAHRASPSGAFLRQ